MAAIGALAGRSRPGELPRRLYLYTQYMFKYGQGWAGANAVTVAPGFASMYRTCALEKLPIDAPGLVIEDFT